MADFQRLPYILLHDNHGEPKVRLISVSFANASLTNGGEGPREGSSRKSSFGERIRILASENICFSPPLRLPSS